jgi:hypothetical protein
MNFNQEIYRSLILFCSKIPKSIFLIYIAAKKPYQKFNFFIKIENTKDPNFSAIKNHQLFSKPGVGYMLTLVSKKIYLHFFGSPVNIYIYVKQKFCSENRVLHTRIRGSGSPEDSIFAKKRDPWLRTGFLTEIATFLSLQILTLL